MEPCFASISAAATFARKRNVFPFLLRSVPAYIYFIVFDFVAKPEPAS